MANILILADSGSGKTTSLCSIPEHNIKGLDPKDTYIISATAKPLPFKGSKSVYPEVTSLSDLPKGKRFISNNGKDVAKAIVAVSDPKSPYKNIVIDDSNYLMQDYYMANALKGGWDVPKAIGSMMSEFFNALEIAAKNGKHVIVLAHMESFQSDSVGSISYRMKVTGKMVTEYVTPEGKFDVVLFVKVDYDEKAKKANYHFVTNRDDKYPAKSPVGMFNDIYIPNDMGYVIEKVNEYYG